MWLLDHPDHHFVLRSIRIGEDVCSVFHIAYCIFMCPQLFMRIVTTLINAGYDVMHNLPAVLALQTHRNRSIRTNASIALVDISTTDQQYIRVFIDLGIMDRFIAYLRNPGLTAERRALLIVRNVIWTKKREHVQYLLERGVLPLVCSNLRSVHRTVVDDALQVCAALLKWSSARYRELYAQLRYDMLNCGAASALRALADKNMSAYCIYGAHFRALCMQMV